MVGHTYTNFGVGDPGEVLDASKRRLETSAESFRICHISQSRVKLLLFDLGGHGCGPGYLLLLVSSSSS